MAINKWPPPIHCSFSIYWNYSPDKVCFWGHAWNISKSNHGQFCLCPLLSEKFPPVIPLKPFDDTYFLFQGPPPSDCYEYGLYWAWYILDVSWSHEEHGTVFFPSRESTPSVREMFSKFVMRIKSRLLWKSVNTYSIPCYVKSIQSSQNTCGIYKSVLSYMECTFPSRFLSCLKRIWNLFWTSRIHFEAVVSVILCSGVPHTRRVFDVGWHLCRISRCAKLWTCWLYCLRYAALRTRAE